MPIQELDQGFINKYQYNNNIGQLKKTRPYSKFTSKITFLFPHQHHLYQFLTLLVLLLRPEVEVQDHLFMIINNAIEKVGCSQPDTNDISYLHFEQ